LDAFDFYGIWRSLDFCSVVGFAKPALAACQLNRPIIDSIARRLLRRGVVCGERLQALLRGAKRLEGIFP
jgi:hypothetical protein